METIEMLKEKLEKEKAKKAKAEENIKKLEVKIEQAEMTVIRAAMKEYNIDIATLTKMLKNNNITEMVQKYEENQTQASLD